jgi:iron-sulfur cluster insertion protein
MIDIKITNEAIIKIKDILAEENKPDLKLRVGVQGGGCAGFSYFFTLDDTQAEDDWDIESNGVHILIDSMSGGYLQGATIDYKEDQYGSNFTLTGMQSTTTCGCGSSFSPF